MPGQLDRNRVLDWLAALDADLPRPECAHCECRLGLLTQLKLDAGDDAIALIEARMPSGGEGTHACLGCSPCPPGEAFVRYLVESHKSQGAR